MMQSDGPKAVRENLASQLLSLGSKVAEQATNTNSRQAQRLECITRPRDTKKEVGPETIAEDWPSLLSNLRSLFWDIEGSLNNMNSTLDRLGI